VRSVYKREELHRESIDIERNIKWRKDKNAHGCQGGVSKGGLSKVIRKEGTGTSRWG